MALNDSLPFFAAESGTYLTTAPNPHVDLSGTVVTIGAYPARTFAAAAADTDTIFADGDTVTVLLVIDADNWARYEGAVWDDDVTDSIDLSNATLQASEGTISNSNTVDVYASQPIGLQSTGSTLDVNQAHTFDVGSPVYSADGSTWSLALANDADKIHIGVVSAIADSSNFTIQFVGPIVTGIDLVTLTPGEYYYLTNAGLLATTPGTIDAPVLFALTSSSGVILPFRAGSTSTSAPTTPTSAGSSWAVPQDAHGFDAITDIGMPVYSSDGFTWAQAAADSASTIHVGVISAVAGVDDFTVQQSGLLEGITFDTLTAGEYYYLQDDGSLDTTPGTIDAPVLFALTASSGVILPFRAGSTSSTLNLVSAPTTPTSAGALGAIAFSGVYVYYCYAPNTWMRIAGEITW